MFTDFILNGRAHGEFAQSLGEIRFETGLLRPWVNDKNQKVCTVNTGRQIKKLDPRTNKPMRDKLGMEIWVPEKETVLVKDLRDAGVESPAFNAAMSLRKDTWRHLDNLVIRAARKRLRAWEDLKNSSQVGGFDAMSKMLYEYETMSDPGEAIQDIEGLASGRTDSPKFQLEGVPLPITYSDFVFSARRLAISANSNTPLNSVMAEAAGRRVAEMVEQVLIGNVTGITYGNASEYSRTPSVYGYTNFPQRIQKTNMTVPTGSNGPTVLGSWLDLLDLLDLANFHGPFMCYVSNDYDRYLDTDYYVSGGNNNGQTLRDRLLKVDRIADIRRLDYLSGPFQVLMVQMESEVAQAINGMPIKTVMWESRGGMQKNFRVMTIAAQVLRADFNGNCGIAHGTTS